MALHSLNVKIGYIFMLGKHGRISAVVAAGGRRIDESCFTSVGLVENSCNIDSLACSATVYIRLLPTYPTATAAVQAFSS